MSCYETRPAVRLALVAGVALCLLLAQVHLSLHVYRGSRPAPTQRGPVETSHAPGQDCHGCVHSAWSAPSPVAHLETPAQAFQLETHLPFEVSLQDAFRPIAPRAPPQV